MLNLPHISSEGIFIIQSIIIIGLPFILRIPKLLRNYFPLVIVQIIISVILGPSILGNISPTIFNFLFPLTSLKALDGLSYLALILFGLLSGLYFDFSKSNKQSKKIITNGFINAIFPTLLGFIMAVLLSKSNMLGQQYQNFSFYLGIGIAIGTTALPVLGSMLQEMDKMDTEFGTKIMSYAAIGDFLLWILITILLSLNSSDGTNILLTITLSLLYISLLYYVIKPWLAKLYRTGFLSNEFNRKHIIFILSLLFASALFTEIIGIHYLLGAFMFGAIVPKEISGGIKLKLQKFVYVCLLPFFFILTGLKTSFNIFDKKIWILFIGITIFSSLIKIFSAAIAERRLNESWLDAFKIGSLMQTKGLMEIIVLNILLSANIINSTIFSAMIMMAITSTIIAKPIYLMIEKYQQKNINNV